MFPILFQLFFVSTFVLTATPVHLSSSFEESSSKVNDPAGFRGHGVTLTQRLPRAVVPSHYDLGIIPIIDPLDEDYLKADGRVVITFTCVESTTVIVLNTAETEIRKPPEVSPSIPVADAKLDPATETLTIELGAPLEVGKIYTVEIYFFSRVADDRQVGLYFSKYLDPSTGEMNYHVATQFQAIEARKAFPCFDEPELKATFVIRIGRQVNLHRSLSNMHQNGDPQPIPGRPDYVYDIYHETPVPMATYLVAIVVMSDFPSVLADPAIYPVPVSVWGPNFVVTQADGQLSADTAAKMLAFFTEYTVHPYDFEKFDSIAVGEFYYGAMENWGLNVYGMQNLFYIEDDMTMEDKWRIMSVIAHEVSHQWFGNAVTCDWWTDLWLNEGLANYMDFVGTAAVVPEYAPWERFGIDNAHSARLNDGMPNAAPVHGDNLTHFEDPPVAQKASALVKMMEGFLTPGTLQRGIQKYVADNLYGSVHQDDLFEALTYQAGQEGFELNVKTIMDPWTIQAGFPLLRVSRISKTMIFISQERFSNSKSYDLDPMFWHIPISYMAASASPTDDHHLPKTWMHQSHLSISHAVDNTDEWILLNPDAYNFYRVVYDDHLRQLLIAQLAQDPTKISALSRGQLIDDYFKIALGEYTTIDVALELTEYLEKETELAVWITLFDNIQNIHNLLSEHGQLGTAFREHFLRKVSPTFESLGTMPHPDDSPVTIMLRSHLLDWACELGHPDCFTSAKGQVDLWMTSGTNPISPDLQPMMYCASVYDGGSNYYDFFLELFQNLAASPRQLGLFLEALSCPSDPELLTRTLELAISDTVSLISKTEDAVRAMGLVTQNVAGRNLAFEFVRSKVNDILESRVGESGIKSAISALGKYYNTVAQRDEVKAFLEENPEFSADLINSINTTIAQIEANIKWMEVHEPGLTRFFFPN